MLQVEIGRNNTQNSCIIHSKKKNYGWCYHNSSEYYGWFRHTHHGHRNPSDKTG